MFEWHDGSLRNGRNVYACRGIPGRKIYDKASNPQVRWDFIRSFSLLDQEITDYSDEVILNHKVNEG